MPDRTIPKVSYMLYSTPMVKKLRAGAKTQTRRKLGIPKWADPHGAIEVDDDGVPHIICTKTGCLSAIPCPYGKAGDLLVVKESAWMWCERRPNGATSTGRQKWLYVPMRGAPVHYAADGTKPSISVVSPDTGNLWEWRPKIGRFLPRWASRLTLQITSVKVERLQEISEADARAEGAPPSHPSIDRISAECGYADTFARSWYGQLWDQINGLDSWKANPWVWVITFRVFDGNIDMVSDVRALNH